MHILSVIGTFVFHSHFFSGCFFRRRSKVAGLSFTVNKGNKNTDKKIRSEKKIDLYFFDKKYRSMCKTIQSLYSSWKKKKKKVLNLFNSRPGVDFHSYV